MMTRFDAVAVAMLCCFAAQAAGRSVILRPDVVYFPDQVAYLRAAHGKCSPDGVFWQGDGQCYAEGSQGPCPFGFLLRLDEVRVRPQCAPDPSVRLDGRSLTPDVLLRDASSLLSFKPYISPSDPRKAATSNNS